jgi:predicted negative regulator of RcsB-dependent stress response
LESGPRAYTIAGSFCRYLLDKFGVTKLRELYRSAGEFERVYDVPLSKLESDWRTFLSSLPVDQNSRAQAEESFRRPAIFHKVCARELAARVSEARSRMGSAAATAVSLLASACNDDPGEPIYQLDLAEALFAAGELDRSMESLAKLKAEGTLTRDLRFRVANLEAGIELRRGRRGACEAALREALANVTDDAEERAALVKLRALKDEDARASLGRVFFGDERGRPLDPGLMVFLIARFAGQVPGDALGPYLLGKQLAQRDPRLAMAQFASACPLQEPLPEVPLPQIFSRECRRQWSETAYLAGDLEAARQAAEWLVASSEREADRLRAADFLARIAWKRLRGFDFHAPPAVVQPRP